MPKVAYVTHKFNSGALSIVHQANNIIDSYMAQGFRLTLRQLYYQFVARDLFPDDRKWAWTGTRWVRDPSGTKNADPNYTWLGNIINKARLAGLIDWESIEDRTRNLKSLAHWGSPGEIIQACAEQYRIDKWATQDYRPQVWIEKDALVGVIEEVCQRNDVPFFSCRGYTSQSEMWSQAQRLLAYAEGGQTPIILHFGDHDPSGIDMTRDICDRMEMFTSQGLEVRRLALNIDQVRQYNPPPNPAKLTDSRCRAYVASFGDESWELDALEPAVLVELVENSILSLRNENAWNEAVQEEMEAREHISRIAEEL